MFGEAHAGGAVIGDADDGFGHVLVVREFGLGKIGREHRLDISGGHRVHLAAGDRQVVVGGRLGQGSRVVIQMRLDKVSMESEDLLPALLQIGRLTATGRKQEPQGR